MKNVEQFDSTAEFIAAGLHYSNGADFDRRLEFAASAGMNQSTPAEGGFLTAPRVTTEAVITKAEETSLLLARVLKLPMGSSNREAFPVVDESSRANGSRWGGIVLGWTDEGVAIVESKPKFRQSAHIASRLSGVIYMTNELRGDGGGPAFELLAGKELGFALEDSVINGSGVGRPLGVLHSDATIEVAPTSRQAPATVTGDNLAAMAARFWSGSYSSGVWLMGVAAFSQLASQSFNGAPVVTYAGGRRYALGFEILISESCAPLGQRGDVILLAPLEYAFATTRETDMMVVSMDVKFLSDESALKVRFRGDGQPLWRTPVTPKDGGPTQSMCVVLGARS
jgi:HK97 family phage major capsid protein